jgi:predicted DNA-binding protein (UPF0251 family)
VWRRAVPNRRTKTTEPDLFSTEANRAQSSLSASQPQGDPSTRDASAAAPAARYVLPNNLHEMIKRLGEDEFDRLVLVVEAEQKRRQPHATLSSKKTIIPSADLPPLALTASKINAVRAAFKAGVKIPQIARQFGISQSDVRKALSKVA